MNDNKDYIINIRVSKETYNKLKGKAKENGQSLSGLVRKTLDDGWEILQDIKKDIFDDKKSGGVAYYQKVIIGQDIPCCRCGIIMLKGDPAFLGETAEGQKKYFCDNCFSNN